MIVTITVIVFATHNMKIDLLYLYLTSSITIMNRQASTEDSYVCHTDFPSKIHLSGRVLFIHCDMLEIVMKIFGRELIGRIRRHKEYICLALRHWYNC